MKCSKINRFYLTEDLYECGTCGNHVCSTCFEKNGGVCPNCYGKLYRVS